MLVHPILFYIYAHLKFTHSLACTHAIKKSVMVNFPCLDSLTKIRRRYRWTFHCNTSCM